MRNKRNDKIIGINVFLLKEGKEIIERSKIPDKNVNAWLILSALKIIKPNVTSKNVPTILEKSIADGNPSLVVFSFFFLKKEPESIKGIKSKPW